MTKHQSKIEKLIAEKCPKGVENRELVNLCKIETGKLNANAAVKDGEHMFFTTAKEISRIDTYRWDTEALLVAGNANVGDVKHYIGKFEAYQRTYVLTNFSKDVDVRFLYFVLSNNLKQYLETRSNKAAMTYIVLSTLQGFKIPLPPLDIQQEIAKILDTFTELEAELEARRKQYEHYRAELLTFEERERERVRWATLGEIGTMIRGNGLQKKDFTETGVGCIHYGQIYTYYGTFADKTKSFVSEALAKKLKKAKMGDVLIAGVSENVEDVCKPLGWLGDEICISGDMFAFRHNQNTRFLTYLLQTPDFQEYKRKHAQGTKVIRVKQEKILKYLVPLPDLSEQERIASILDKFEKIVNDISIGLPAELKARRSQYEYYRGKLLTFPEYAH